jgi:hypothetical protein
MTEHVDMSQFIAARSDQLNADDLLDARARSRSRR